jgi:hypothetical protein
MTHSETILPDLPDSEQIRELRFHLRSLQQDLAASIARLELCLPLPAMEPATAWRLRETVATATAAIEHDARHHVQRALDLVSVVSGGADHAPLEVEPAVMPSLTAPVDPVSGATRDQLERALGDALAALARAQAIIVEIAATQGDDAATLRARVSIAAETLWRVAWPAAQRCLALAQVLHHAADPAAASDEARADELATPLREVAIDAARSLSSCPRCGAPLAAEDRTFDGSYCESCRTRFFQLEPRTG